MDLNCAQGHQCALMEQFSLIIARLMLDYHWKFKYFVEIHPPVAEGRICQSINVSVNQRPGRPS